MFLQKNAVLRVYKKCALYKKGQQLFVADSFNLQIVTIVLTRET